MTTDRQPRPSNINLLLHALAAGADTIPAAVKATGLDRVSVRSAMSRLQVVDAVESTGSRQHALARYTLVLDIEEVLRRLNSAREKREDGRPRARFDATELLRCLGPWPVANP